MQRVSSTDSDAGLMEGEEEALETKKAKDMIYAARTGDLDGVKAQIDEGVPVGFRDSSGWTALKWASSEGHQEVVAYLLEASAAEAEVVVADEPSGAAGAPTGGGSPLHWASYKGHARIVWRLLTCAQPLDPKEVDTEGNTPLHLAAAGGHLLIIQTMLSQGVDVHLKNAYGNKPVELSTSPECQALLRAAATAAVEGRSCFGARRGLLSSPARRSAALWGGCARAPNLRPVRYSNDCQGSIRSAEEALANAIKAVDVGQLEAAIGAAEKIGASLPMIENATAGLERLQAQLSLQHEIATLTEHRPLRDRALMKPLLQPLKRAREKGVTPSLITEADRLCQTLDAEVCLHDVLSQCASFKMRDNEDGSFADVPSADSDESKRAEAGIGKLASAIATAQAVEAMHELVEAAEAELTWLSSELELRKALLEPKEGVADDGTPSWTQHTGLVTYSRLEDLLMRNDWLDTAVEKCIGAGTCEGAIDFAAKAQKTLKAALKQAALEDEERKMKEAAAAAKAAKKKKGGAKK